MSQSNKPNKTHKQGPGYHITTIKKGVVGELSKVMEEIKGAFLVAGDKRVLKRLARVIGAMQLYLRHNYPGMYFTGMTLKDLSLMSAVTRRAFDNGHR